MSSLAVATGLAGRSLKLIPRVPSTFIPSVVMPIFLTIAFAGPFANLVKLPGFPADKIIDWIIPMTMIQGGMFAGITTGMSMARDFENGFYDRFLMSPASRTSLLAGPLLAAALRALIPFVLLLGIAIVGKAHFRGGLVGVGTLAIAVIGCAVAAGAWASGLALRFKTFQIAPLMQAGVFLSVFTSTAQMPLDLLTGWVHTVARFNPMTNVLALARQGFLGDVTWAATWPGLLALAGVIGGLLLFAGRGMRKAIV
ncbi:MAG: type transport system permease protein [Actinomycetota bacterium]|nr:type transport system permease protein [Actinomycetota bacterium]